MGMPSHTKNAEWSKAIDSIRVKFDAQRWGEWANGGLESYSDGTRKPYSELAIVRRMYGTLSHD